MIKDSGNRREYETGAVRDMAAGKGRCDLLPLDVAAIMLQGGTILWLISEYQRSEETRFLYKALANFAKAASGTYPPCC